MSGPHPPDASVVVATYRRPERITRLLHALAGQTVDPDRFEVIVVDDCSGDATASLIAELAGEVPYRLRPMRTPANAGPAGARNQGWRTAAAPVVAFTDDDCVPDPGWLAAGLAALAGDPLLGVVQGRTGPPADLDPSTLRRWNHRQDIDAPTPYFEACNVFYRATALADGGGFDEALRWWGEDAACGWAVLDAGWSRGFAPGAIVTHDVEERPLRWYVRNGLLEDHIVRLAGRHPGFRSEAFWHHWSYRRDDTAFKVAVLGLVAARRWRPAALAALPYLWWRRPSLRQRDALVQWVERLAVDAARSAGQLSGALRAGILVV